MTLNPMADFHTKQAVALATRVGMAAAKEDYPRNPLESDLFSAAMGEVSPEFETLLVEGYVKGFDAANALVGI